MDPAGDRREQRGWCVRGVGWVRSSHSGDSSSVSIPGERITFDLFDIRT